MSSFRNAIKRVTHKERSQPVARQHLGILEKKKDYRVRAKDYHRKEDVLTNMRKKASMKNPDEFYFGMNNAQIVDGKHRKLEQVRFKEKEHLVGSEAVKIMKNQDLNYVRLLRMRDEKKIEKLQASLHYIGEPEGTKETKHTIFMDSKEAATKFDPVHHFDTLPDFVERSFNRPRKDTFMPQRHDPYDEEYSGESDTVSIDDKTKIKRARLAKKQAMKIAKARLTSYKEVEARKKRLVELKNAEAHLVTERIVASKGRKRKIAEAENGKPAIYKFRRKRAA